jgi:Ser/Thr protein kinase RdoA (MazF antagonist)
MNMPSAHPYDSLTPDVVLDAIEATGLRCDGRLMTLSSYENRVYMAHLEDGAQIVAKFYRPARWSDAQILEEHAFALQLQAAEIPLAAPLVVNGHTLHQHAGFGYSITPRMGGRRPELDDFETLEWIGRFLARIHSVGAAQPFAHRPALDVQSFALQPRDWLLAHDMIPLDVRSQWCNAFDGAINSIAACALFHWANGLISLQNTVIQLRLHGDCHPGNILWTPADMPVRAGGPHHTPGPHFVDLDDARTGPAVQDLWMLLSGDRAQRTQQLAALIDGYEQFRPFDRRELALIEPLRTLRLIHYSAWLAQRWTDPAFPAAFPHFGSSAYWQGQADMLREQVQVMQEEPLYV